MNFIASTYKSAVKKAKHWMNPNQNPTDNDKYAFSLLDKAQVQLFIDYMQLQQVNINVTDFNKVSLLIKAQAIPTFQNKYTKNLSEQQLEERAIKAINYLMKRGVDINYQSKDGRTALLSACHWGYAKIVQCLLKHGANPDIGSDVMGFKTNPLLSAMYKGHKEVVMLLILYGADPAKTQQISQQTSGFKLDEEQLSEIWSKHNVWKLMYLKKIQQVKKRKTVLTQCSEMVFDEILTLM